MLPFRISLVFILFPFVLWAQSQPKIDSETIDQLLYQYANDSTPGMAVGIVANGSIVYEKYVGYSNLEHTIEIGPDTRFNIASNAKQFTALCILRLMEEGKLQLSDDIRTYLTDLYPDIKEKITIAQLLNHTSGIRDIYALWSLRGQTWWQLFVDNKDAVALVKEQKDLNFKPGSEYMYSNSNYILLTEIVKTITGTDFDAYCDDVFKSLGMNGSSFLSNYMEVVPHKARPYANWNGWKEYPFVSDTHGDGALFTTLVDQMQWEMILQRNDGSYLSKDIVGLSQKPVIPSEISSDGFGLMFDTYKGQTRAYHNGSTGVYNATLYRYPNSQTTIIVMSNSGKVPTVYLAQQITDEVLQLQSVNETYPAGPERIFEDIDSSETVGVYRKAGGIGSIIRIVEKEDGLYREMEGRDPVRLLQENESLYQYSNNKDLKMAFESDANGVVGFTIYLSSQPPLAYRKLPELPSEENYAASIAGTYENEENNTSFTIAHRSGNTYGITKDGRERDGELLYKDFLMINSYEIEVRRDKNDKVIGLAVSNDRLKNVMFKRVD